MRFSYIVFALFFGTFLLATPVSAQKMTISGFVTDSTSGEKLFGAFVYNQSVGTVTNEFGFYSISFDKDTVQLTFSYVGCQSVKKTFIGRKAHNFNVELALFQSKEVQINAEKSAGNRIQEKSEMSTIQIPVAQIKKIPALFGEVDVLKVIQLLPGVAKGTEGASGIYVRGGGPDQNLILLDGVQVYNVNHLFGFFSVFNGDAINNVTLVKGGFPARYGGRLSSVIDINMKEGNNKKLKVEGGVGIISSRLTIEGPIKDQNTTFLISGRRTYADLFMRPLSYFLSNRQGSLGYYFYDLNAKINHRFSDKDRLFLSSYMGKDVFGLNASSSYSDNLTYYKDKLSSTLNWGNITTALRWNHVLNPKLFMNLTATYSRYNFNIGAENSSTTRDLTSGTTQTQAFGIGYISGIYDDGLKLDFDYLPNASHHIRFGSNYIYHTFKPGVTAFKLNINGTGLDTSYGSKNIYAHEGFLYLEDDWNISKRLKVNVGLHGSAFKLTDTTYRSLQPRISARFLLNPDLSFKVSATKMTQYLHLLTNNGIGLPTDFWVPATKKVAPQQSIQYAAGFAYTFKDNYEFSIEGYYKTMSNVIEYKNGASFLLGGQDWQSKITSGKAWSYGSELFLQRKFGKTTGWVGYTLSWAYRQFEDKNNGKPYFYKYDRRHDIGVVVSHEFSKKIDVSATWIYSTGNALTLATERFYSLAGTSKINFFAFDNATGVNEFRMPAYHRLDIGANFHKYYKKFELTYNVSVYNAYNRLNAFFVYKTVDDFGKPVLRKVTIFPILPSFTLNFKF
jgi:outer membrane receptor for ferrienterochelin and colicin